MRYLLPLTVLIAALLPLPAVSQTEAAGQLPRVGERILGRIRQSRNGSGRILLTSEVDLVIAAILIDVGGVVHGRDDSDESPEGGADQDA